MAKFKKKYIIGIDTNLINGETKGERAKYRTFMFIKKHTYDTIEQAEESILNCMDKPDTETTDNPVYYTIIPIYIKV